MTPRTAGILYPRRRFKIFVKRKKRNSCKTYKNNKDEFFVRYLFFKDKAQNRCKHTGQSAVHKRYFINVSDFGKESSRGNNKYTKKSDEIKNKGSKSSSAVSMSRYKTPQNKHHIRLHLSVH